MAKRKMSENSLKNLLQGKKISEETARDYQKKSSEAQKENTKIRKQNEAFQISSQKSLDKIQVSTLDNLASYLKRLSEKENLTPQEAKILMEGLQFLRDSSGQKPTDKQEVIGNLGIEKVFITPKEAKQTDNHIDDVINEQS